MVTSLMKEYKGSVKEAYDFALSIGIRQCEAEEIAEELLLGKAETFSEAYENVGIRWIEWDLKMLDESPEDYFISTELGQYICFGVEANVISPYSWMYRKLNELDFITWRNTQSA
jgi:hypothetical protein